ncbi:MAG: SGNH/GDSL hydrolase family protein [Lautropia sp.]
MTSWLSPPARSRTRAGSPARWLAVGIAGLLAVLPAAARASAADDAQRCAVPAELDPADEPLQGLAKTLTNGSSPKTIVVLGPQASGAKNVDGVIGYPARLQARLASDLGPALDGRTINVETIGQLRGSVGELAGLIQRQVLPLKPALVVWQVGRADARRGHATYRFGQDLKQGLDALQQRGIDTILIDIQYHPQFEALYRTDEYRRYLRRIAGMRNVPLLRRYQMIEYWESAGAIDLDSASREVQQRSFEFIQDCLAYQLSRLIAAGVHSTRPAPPR